MKKEYERLEASLKLKSVLNKWDDSRMSNLSEEDVEVLVENLKTLQKEVDKHLHTGFDLEGKLYLAIEEIKKLKGK